MSATFRYARILNGFSFLISRRSAISRRMRAMAALSNAQTFHLDLVLDHARSARGQRGRDRLSRGRRSIAEQASAAAGAADLGCRGAGALGPRDQLFDCVGRHAGGQLPPVVPLAIDLAAHFVPVGAQEGLTHGDSRVADALEAIED